MKTLLLTIAVILANVAGNLALDWGAKHDPSSMPAKLANPAILAGIGILILWTLLKITLLSVTSVGYALNAVAAWLLFAEVISSRRWLGIALITLGAVIAGRSHGRAPQ
jgi:drug/metabolite transporter (DMT)-like permease